MMGYNKHEWIARVGTGLNKWRDQISNVLFEFLNEPDSVSIPGTPFQAAWLNEMEDGIAGAFNRSEQNSKGVATNSAVIDELLVEAGISTKLAPTSGKFYDYVGASGQLSQGFIDFGKTYAETVTTGISTLAMTALQVDKNGDTPSLLSECFEDGEEVTLQGRSINEFDGEYEQGSFSPVGEPTISVNAVRTINFADVKSGEQHTITTKFSGITSSYFVKVYGYDNNENFVSLIVNDVPVTDESGVTFEVPENVAKVKYRYYNNATPITPENITRTQLELGSSATTYQNYIIKENLTVSSVTDGTKTLGFTSTIQNTYPNGANCYRSNMKVNGQVWNFGAFSASETIDKSTPVQVVNAAYSTDGNGGRKVARLDNGWIVALLYDSIFPYYTLELTKDNWATKITMKGDGTVSNPERGLALETEGNNIHILGATSNSIAFTSLDATTLNDLDTFPVPIVETGYNTIDDNSLSLGINEFGGKDKITYGVCGKKPSHPNSNNLFARQGTISAGVVTWGSVEQVFTANLSGYNHIDPSVIYSDNDRPSIISIYQTASNWFVQTSNYNGSTWDLVDIYNSGSSSYIQGNPSATFMPPSVATLINASYTSGLIIVAWEGKDATDAAENNIRCKASSDNGATWFDFGVTNEKITSGNTLGQSRPTISWNNDGDIFILWRGNTVVTGTQMRLIENTVSVGWCSIEDIDTTLTTKINANSVNNFHDFEKPLTIWSDSTDGDVKFYGVWTAGTEVEVTDIDIRMNIAPLQSVNDIGAYMNISNNVNTVDGSVSIVDSVADESYIDLIDSRYAINATNDEVGSFIDPPDTPTAEEKVTLKYSLNRTLTTDVIELTSILGGVA